MLRSLLIVTAALVFILTSSPDLRAGTGERTAGDGTFLELSIEELMKVEVTSAGKKPQELMDVASAIYVITEEDIRRSFSTTVPELLRVVPGMEVARIDASKWAVTARGFNDRFSNKLLVVIDGRTVYSPLFSGVYWDVQDLLLEDIERIEVIRGPGGTLWGANAVNGVVNIITKGAKDSQGGVVATLVGDRHRVPVGMRYGGEAGADAYYRVYAKYFDRGSFVDSRGDAANDGWRAGRTGFRMDRRAGGGGLTVLGDIYSGEADLTGNLTSLSPPYSLTVKDTAKTRGGDILMRWEKAFSNRSEIVLQGYYDLAEREDTSLRQRIDTYDLDLHHRFFMGQGHEITWGAGYRRVWDQLHGSFTVSFDPESRSTDLFSAFLQDEVRLAEKLRLTIGSKFEENDYTGFEYHPNVRVLWSPAEDHAVWAAVSRVTMTPSRSHSDIRINTAVVPGATPTVISQFGSRDFASEELVAYEAGYRGRPTQSLFVDLASFYNYYRNFLTRERRSPFLESQPSPPHLVVPLVFENRMEGETYGIEASVKWQVMRRWQLVPGYTWLKINLRPDSSSTDTTQADEVAGRNPQHQFQLRSYLDLPRRMEFDAAAYYVDNLPSLDVKSYTRLDLRLGWRPSPELEAAIVAQNLLEERHKEFSTRDTAAAEIPRSFYLKVTYRF